MTDKTDRARPDDHFIVAHDLHLGARAPGEGVRYIDAFGFNLRAAPQAAEQKPKRRRASRKPGVDRLAKVAVKHGVTVKTDDGVTIMPPGAAPAEDNSSANEWDEVLPKERLQ